MRVAALVTLAACGRIDFEPLSVSSSAQPQVCLDSWCWEAPLPHGEPVFAVASTAPDDVWAVGGRGLVMHYDGTTWQIDHVERTDYHGVAAIARDDVWIVGYHGLAHFDGNAWTTSSLPDAPTRGTPEPNAMWASASDDVWVGSFQGVESHFDGTAWSTKEIASGSQDFYAVWGTARDDVWLAGDGVTLHYDGATFSSGAPTGQLALVWGFSRDDVWLGDESTVLVHDSAGTWSPVSTNGQYAFSSGWSPGPNEMWADDFGSTLVHATPSGGAVSVDVPGISTIWGLGGTADDAWGVGDGGRFIHFDGSSWTPLYGPIGEDVAAISGTGNGDAWAVGAHGTLLHRDATGWTPFDAPGGAATSFQAVWALGPDDVFAAGTLLVHWDGTKWTDVGESGRTYLSVWATSDHDVWAVAEVGTTSELRHFDGTSWSLDASVTSPNAVWGTGPGDVWVSTVINTPITGRVFHLEAGTWVERFDPPLPHYIYAFAGTGPNDVWMLGVNSSVLYHWDGTSVTVVSSAFVGNQILRAGWARSPNEAYFVGFYDALFEWNGTALVELSAPTSTPMAGMWGDADRVWIVGQDGAILSHAYGQ